MADIAFTTSGNPATSDARVVDDVLDRHTAAASVVIKAGQAIRLNAANKWVLANATTAPNAAGVYIAARNAGVNQGLTGIRQGKLAGLPTNLTGGTPVYLSDTPGALADAAGTVSVLVGRIVEVGVMTFALPL